MNVLWLYLGLICWGVHSETTENITEIDSTTAFNEIIKSIPMLNYKEILQHFLQDPFIRYPLGIVFDVDSMFLQNVKHWWREQEMRSGEEFQSLLLVTGEGIESISRQTSILDLQKTIQSIKIDPSNKSTEQLQSIHHMLKLLDLIPYDSSIILVTGKLPADDELKILAIERIIKKRCKINIIWTNDAMSDNNILQEISEITGGSFYDITKAINDENELTDLVIHTLTGLRVTEIPVSDKIKYLDITIRGNVTMAELRTPEGNTKELMSGGSVDSLMVTVPVNMTGTWLLVTNSDDGQTYNIMIKTHDSNKVKRDISTINQDSQFSNLKFPDDNLDDINIETLPEDNIYTKLASQDNNGADITKIKTVQRQVQSKSLGEIYIPLIVELESGTTLDVAPGIQTTINYEVINNKDVPIQAAFIASSEHNFITDVQPRQQYLQPKQGIRVQVSLSVPQNVQSEITDTIRLVVNGKITSEPIPITATRLAYLYISSKQTKDRWRPDVSVSYSGSCWDYRDIGNCQNGRWTAEITAEDRDSGLLKIISRPVGLFFKSAFMAGMKTPITVTYTATCCEPRVDVWVEDAKAHYVKRELDVNNQILTQEGIAAVVLGVLLFIALIFLIILIVLVCRRRNKIRIDLPRHRRSTS